MDCDGDALVVLVDQHGKGACHTGNRTCFFRTVGSGPGVPPRSDGRFVSVVDRKLSFRP